MELIPDPFYAYSKKSMHKQIDNRYLYIYHPYQLQNKENAYIKHVFVYKENVVDEFLEMLTLLSYFAFENVMSFNAAHEFPWKNSVSQKSDIPCSK